MKSTFSELSIRKHLQAAYHPGVVANSIEDQGLNRVESLRCAAVLVPLAWFQDEWLLIFTRRTEKVEHHKGQVSFPGGVCAPYESSPEETALREAMEETGLASDDVTILGFLNDIGTNSGYKVSPVVGKIPYPYAFHPEECEVDRIFSIPLHWLSDRNNWAERHSTPAGIVLKSPVITFKEYDHEVLWGVSARIVINLLQVLGLLKKSP